MRAQARDRLISGIGAVAATALLGALLLAGLTVGPERVRDVALAVIDVAPPAPPPPPRRPDPPRLVHRPRAARAAGAPAPRIRATPVVVPPPVVPLPAPPVVAAREPDLGAAPASGASDRGTGSGAAGEGDGPGGGGEGGDGGDVAPEQIAGRLKFSDLPRGLGPGRWRVYVRYYVGVDGRVGDCRVTRSSGDSGVDQATCDAIRRRFRFRPAEDGAGRPHGGDIEEYHDWTIEGERSGGETPPPR